MGLREVRIVSMKCGAHGEVTGRGPTGFVRVGSGRRSDTMGGAHLDGS